MKNFDFHCSLWHTKNIPTGQLFVKKKIPAGMFYFGVVMEVLGRQQIRTQETQKRLVDAAEEIFVRDGFEGAQLDAIAAAAGRSKGAVYTHFKSKEDLFLALFEQRTRSYVDRLVDSLRKCTDRKHRLQAFRNFFVDLAHDRTWPILTLEFKLYALRHPESKERLRKTFEISRETRGSRHYEQMFGKLTPAQRADNDLALLALGPIVTGLILESYFEQEKLSDAGIRRLLGRIFEALFPGDSRS